MLQWLLTLFASLFSFSSCPPPCLSTGQHCTEDVNECRLQPNTCQNGGTCSNLIGSYQCVCVNGWSGADCSENIDDCATAACSPGSTCIDRVASFVCLCPHGKTGKPVVTNHMQIFLHQTLELHKVDDCITRYNVRYCEIVNIWKQNWKTVEKKELNVIHVKQSETLIIPQSRFEFPADYWHILWFGLSLTLIILSPAANMHLVSFFLTSAEPCGVHFCFKIFYSKHFTHSLSTCVFFQVCSAIETMPVSVTPVERALSVTPTPSAACSTATVHLDM